MSSSCSSSSSFWVFDRPKSSSSSWPSWKFNDFRWRVGGSNLGHLFTVIADILVRVKNSCSSARELSYAINFRTARTASHTQLYVDGFRMLLNIHLFAGRAVKRERRKGSSRRQQPAYGAAVNEVARELLRSVRSPKRENGGRRYIKHDGMIASPVGSCLCCWQLPLSPPVPPLYCSAPHCPSLSLFDQVWCIQRCDCVNCT